MKTPLDVPVIIERYNAGVGLAVIGIAHHTSRKRIRAVLADAGVAIRPVGTNAEPLRRIDRASIIERYTAGEGLVEISRADRMSADRVREVLVAADIAIRLGRPRSDPLDVAALIERYNAGETIGNIASSVGRAFRTIRAAFEAADIPIRTRPIQKAGVKPLWRTCPICQTRIPAVEWHDHQRTTHTAPATPASVIRRNVAAYIAALETTPTPERSHCAGCKQRPCITPLCCGRRLRALTQHANRKEIR